MCDLGQLFPENDVKLEHLLKNYSLMSDSDTRNEIAHVAFVTFDERTKIDPRLRDITLQDQEDYLHTLSGEHIEALKDYIKEHQVYSYLTTKTKSKKSLYANYAHLIDDVFAGIPALKKDMVVYRGVYIDDSSVLTTSQLMKALNNDFNDTYTSTTWNVYTATDYATGHGGKVLAIRVPKGQKVIPLYSMNMSEYEILLDRAGEYQLYCNLNSPVEMKFDNDLLQLFYMTYTAHARHPTLRSKRAIKRSTRSLNRITPYARTPVRNDWWDKTNKTFTDKIRGELWSTKHIDALAKYIKTNQKCPKELPLYMESPKEAYWEYENAVIKENVDRYTKIIQIFSVYAKHCTKDPQYEPYVWKGLVRILLGEGQYRPKMIPTSARDVNISLIFQYFPQDRELIKRYIAERDPYFFDYWSGPSDESSLSESSTSSESSGYDSSDSFELN